MAFAFVKLGLVLAVIVVWAAGVPVRIAVPPLPVTRQPAWMRESELQVPLAKVRVMLEPVAAEGVTLTL